MSMSSSPATENIPRRSNSATTSNIAGKNVKPDHTRSVPPIASRLPTADDRNSLQALKRGANAAPATKAEPQVEPVHRPLPNRNPPAHRIDEPPPLTTEEWAYALSGYGEPRLPVPAVGPTPIEKPANIPEVVPESRWIVARSMADLPVIASEIRYWNDQLLRYLEAPQDIYVVIGKDIWFRLLEIVKIFSSRYHILEPTEALLQAKTDKERQKALREEGERLVKRYRRNIADLPRPLADPPQNTGDLTTEEWRELLSSKG